MTRTYSDHGLMNSPYLPKKTSKSLEIFRKVIKTIFFFNQVTYFAYSKFFYGVSVIFRTHPIKNRVKGTHALVNYPLWTNTFRLTVYIKPTGFNNAIHLKRNIKKLQQCKLKNKISGRANIWTSGWCFENFGKRISHKHFPEFQEILLIYRFLKSEH